MNSSIRYLITLVIVIGAIVLFFLIPNPMEMLENSGGGGIGLGIIGIVLLPLYFAFYVAIVAILFVSTWNLIAYIFKDDDDDNDDEVSIEHQVSKVILTSKNSEVNFKNHPNDMNSSLFKKTLKIIGIIIMICFSSIILLYAFFGIMLKNSNDNNIKKEYSMHYDTEDYNDSRIIFYNNALKESSQKFLLAENMYDIFEANTKRDIALDCIRLLRKEHNATTKYQVDNQINWFKQNAINSYTSSEDNVKKSVENENYLRKHSLEYNSYSLPEIYKQLPNRCTEQLSVDTIYNKFIPQYIKSQERRIDNYYITYNPKEPIRKRYKQWLRTLYEKYPQYSKRANFY